MSYDRYIVGFVSLDVNRVQVDNCELGYNIRK